MVTGVADAADAVIEMAIASKQKAILVVNDQDDAKLLWIRISRFELDEPGSSLPFSMRLARENGWSRNYACRVIEEYKRFCYLAVTLDHPVTPSDPVDQAWHLHLLHTKSYWDVFCPNILGQPLHHSPTRGGAEETKKFRQWYTQTLSSYERTFGPPQKDIWADVEARFMPPKRFLRVNLSDNWIVPKPKWLRRQI
jgi:hypothetical protein